MKDKIYIFDTTLRDGEQSPGCSMNTKEKLKMARQLEALNVDVIEAGFPISSEGDFEAVKEIAKTIKGPIIAALARAIPLDIDRAFEAIQYSSKPRIHMFIATSDIHLKHKLKKTREEVFEQSVNAVAYAKKLTAGCRVQLRRCEPQRLKLSLRLIEAVINAGAGSRESPRHRRLRHSF